MQTESNAARSPSRSPVSSKRLLSICTVKVVDDFVLEMEISDGRTITRDFSSFVKHARGLLERLRDPKFFAQVFVDDGALTWPDEIDINPLRVIYGENWTTSRRVPKSASL